jgi:hypothetical protein
MMLVVSAFKLPSLVVLLLLSIGACTATSNSDASSFLVPKARTAIPRGGDVSGKKSNYESSAESLTPISRGGGTITKGSKKEGSSSTTPLLLNPRFLFKFMAVGTASFGIPALLAPKLMHPLLVASSTEFPIDNTFYVYMFALRECYLASTFGMAAYMPSSTLKAWQLWGIIVLGTQSILNIFHSGWNKMLQPMIIGIHLFCLTLNVLSYKFAVVDDDSS